MSNGTEVRCWKKPVPQAADAGLKNCSSLRDDALHEKGKSRDGHISKLEQARQELYNNPTFQNILLQFKRLTKDDLRVRELQGSQTFAEASQLMLEKQKKERRRGERLTFISECIQVIKKLGLSETDEALNIVEDAQSGIDYPKEELEAFVEELLKTINSNNLPLQLFQGMSWKEIIFESILKAEPNSKGLKLAEDAGALLDIRLKKALDERRGILDEEYIRVASRSPEIAAFNRREAVKIYLQDIELAETDALLKNIKSARTAINDLLIATKDAGYPIPWDEVLAFDDALRKLLVEEEIDAGTKYEIQDEFINLYDCLVEDGRLSDEEGRTLGVQSVKDKLYLIRNRDNFQSERESAEQIQTRAVSLANDLSGYIKANLNDYEVLSLYLEVLLEASKVKNPIKKEYARELARSLYKKSGNERALVSDFIPLAEQKLINALAKHLAGIKENTPQALAAKAAGLELRDKLSYNENKELKEFKAEVVRRQDALKNLRERICAELGGDANGYELSLDIDVPLVVRLKAAKTFPQLAAAVFGVKEEEIKSIQISLLVQSNPLLEEYVDLGVIPAGTQISLCATEQGSRYEIAELQLQRLTLEHTVSPQFQLTVLEEKLSSDSLERAKELIFQLKNAESKKREVVRFLEGLRHFIEVRRSAHQVALNGDVESALKIISEIEPEIESLLTLQDPALSKEVKELIRIYKNIDAEFLTVAAEAAAKQGNTAEFKRRIESAINLLESRRHSTKITKEERVEASKQLLSLHGIKLSGISQDTVHKRYGEIRREAAAMLHLIAPRADVERLLDESDQDLVSLAKKANPDLEFVDDIKGGVEWLFNKLGAKDATANEKASIAGGLGKLKFLNSEYQELRSKRIESLAAIVESTKATELLLADLCDAGLISAEALAIQLSEIRALCFGALGDAHAAAGQIQLAKEAYNLQLSSRLTLDHGIFSDLETREVNQDGSEITELESWFNFSEDTKVGFIPENRLQECLERVGGLSTTARQHFIRELLMFSRFAKEQQLVSEINVVRQILDRLSSESEKRLLSLQKEDLDEHEARDRELSVIVQAHIAKADYLGLVGNFAAGQIVLKKAEARASTINDTEVRSYLTSVTVWGQAAYIVSKAATASREKKNEAMAELAKFREQLEEELANNKDPRLDRHNVAQLYALEAGTWLSFDESERALEIVEKLRARYGNEAELPEVKTALAAFDQESKNGSFTSALQVFLHQLNDQSLADVFIYQGGGILAGAAAGFTIGLATPAPGGALAGLGLGALIGIAGGTFVLKSRNLILGWHKIAQGYRTGINDISWGDSFIDGISFVADAATIFAGGTGAFKAYKLALKNSVKEGVLGVGGTVEKISQKGFVNRLADGVAKNGGKIAVETVNFGGGTMTLLQIGAVAAPFAHTIYIIDNNPDLSSEERRRLKDSLLMQAAKAALVGGVFIGINFGAAKLAEAPAVICRKLAAKLKQNGGFKQSTPNIEIEAVKPEYYSPKEAAIEAPEPVKVESSKEPSIEELNAEAVRSEFAETVISAETERLIAELEAEGFRSLDLEPEVIKTEKENLIPEKLEYLEGEEGTTSYLPPEPEPAAQFGDSPLERAHTDESLPIPEDLDSIYREIHTIERADTTSSGKRFDSQILESPHDYYPPTHQDVASMQTNLEPQHLNIPELDIAVRPSKARMESGVLAELEAKPSELHLERTESPDVVAVMDEPLSIPNSIEEFESLYETAGTQQNGGRKNIDLDLPKQVKEYNPTKMKVAEPELAKPEVELSKPCRAELVKQKIVLDDMPIEAEVKTEFIGGRANITTTTGVLEHYNDEEGAPLSEGINQGKSLLNNTEGNKRSRRKRNAKIEARYQQQEEKRVDGIMFKFETAKNQSISLKMRRIVGKRRRGSEGLFSSVMSELSEFFGISDKFDDDRYSE